MLPRQDTDERNMTRQDFVYELEKETLHELRYYLCNHLQPEKLLPWLQSKKVLTIDHAEIIASEKTTNSKVNRLVDFIIKSGPGCLELFKRAIRKSNKTQIFIAEKMETRFNEVKNRQQNIAKLQLTPLNPSPPPPYSESNRSYPLPITTLPSSLSKVPSPSTSECETLWGRSYFRSKDFRTLHNSVASALDKDHNTTQAENSGYLPAQLLPSTSNRGWADSEYLGSGSSIPHIDLEQQVEYEKLQAKLQSNRPSTSIRQPEEHDVRESGRSLPSIYDPDSQNTEVKQLTPPSSGSFNILYPPSEELSFEITVNESVMEQ